MYEAKHNPHKIAEILKERGYLASLIVGGVLISVFDFLKFDLHYVWCLWKKRSTISENLKYLYMNMILLSKMVKYSTEVKIPRVKWFVCYDKKKKTLLKWFIPKDCFGG